MRLLLDTHVLLVLIEHGVAGLPAAIAELSSRRDGEYHLSAASLWEIAIKWRLGKLRLTPELTAMPDLLGDMGVKIIAIDEHHALASVEPEPITRDPFDRMLLAQCQVEGLRLLTIDRALESHPLAARG